MCHRRTRNSDILSKVALLLVLLPHMAQTQYVRGKQKNITILKHRESSLNTVFWLSEEIVISAAAVASLGI